MGPYLRLQPYSPWTTGGIKVSVGTINVTNTFQPISLRRYVLSPGFSLYFSIYFVTHSSPGTQVVLDDGGSFPLL